MLDTVFIEIDMLVTDDMRIIGGHDWKHFASITNGQARTLAEVKKYKIFDQFSVLYDETITEYFFKYPNAYLVTDKIQNYKLIVDTFPFYRDRLLVEVFSLIDYNNALNEGIRYPMLNISSEQELQRFFQILDSDKVSMITCSVELIEEVPLKLQKLYNRGVNIFAYSSNNIELIKKNIGKTVSGFYTDDILPKDILNHEKK